MLGTLLVRERIITTVYGAEGSVVPLNTSTTARVVNQVCTILVESTHCIRLRNNGVKIVNEEFESRTRSSSKFFMLKTGSI